MLDRLNLCKVPDDEETKRKNAKTHNQEVADEAQEESEDLTSKTQSKCDGFTEVIRLLQSLGMQEHVGTLQKAGCMAVEQLTLEDLTHLGLPFFHAKTIAKAAIARGQPVTEAAEGAPGDEVPSQDADQKHVTWQFIFAQCSAMAKVRSDGGSGRYEFVNTYLRKMRGKEGPSLSEGNLRRWEKWMPMITKDGRLHPALKAENFKPTPKGFTAFQRWLED
jgi:hypothetical protein